MNISAKTKIFSKIFKGVNLGSRYYEFMKKPDFENLMLLSLYISICIQIKQSPSGLFILTERLDILTNKLGFLTKGIGTYIEIRHYNKEISHSNLCGDQASLQTDLASLYVWRLGIQICVKIGHPYKQIRHLDIKILTKILNIPSIQMRKPDNTIRHPSMTLVVMVILRLGSHFIDRSATLCTFPMRLFF